MPLLRSAPTCFAALPTRSAKVAGDADVWANHRDVLDQIEKAVVAADMNFVRADFSEHDGFLERSMLERLLIADVVIADVTTANPQVMYTIGVRDGGMFRPTILISGRVYPQGVCSGRGTSDVLSYTIGADVASFEEGLARQLSQAFDGDLPYGVPLLDATGWTMGGSLDHDKTDVFLERIAATSSIGRHIRTALELGERAVSIEALRKLERELLNGDRDIFDRDTGLLGVYIGYRECGAYEHMIDLYPRMPPELRSSPLVREQLAFAFNRLAEANDGDETGLSARQLRTSALASLSAIDSHDVTTETLAIRGRIYKGWFQTAVTAGNDGEAHDMLTRAIESYEQAMKADMRDYFPGINAITLRLTRGLPEDMDATAQLVPVVRMAVENAPLARSDPERYWQVATKLELACASRDWNAAVNHVSTAIRLDVHDWMYTTTIRNLGMYRSIFSRDAAAMAQLEDVIEHLGR
jgi:hypothetical protein